MTETSRSFAIMRALLREGMAEEAECIARMRVNPPSSWDDRREAGELPRHSLMYLFRWDMGIHGDSYWADVYRTLKGGTCTTTTDPLGITHDIKGET